MLPTRRFSGKLFRPLKPGSMRGMLFNSLLACLDIGFLVFPQLYQDTGVITMTVLMIVMGFVNLWAARLLDDCLVLAQAQSWQHMCFQVGGIKLRRAFTLV